MPVWSSTCKRTTPLRAAQVKQLTSMNKNIKDISFKGILFRKGWSNFGNKPENELLPRLPEILSER